MLVQLTCKYCGFKCQTQLYSQQQVKSMTCDRCHDKNLSMKSLEEGKIDYYQGSPPFIEDTTLEDLHDMSQDIYDRINNAD